MVRKMKDNLVSVIIPTYNSEKYIEETLNSVLNQTYREFEIIIIDDCSKDNTFEIVKEYEKKYSNIVCLKQEQNKGVAEARNRGIKKSRGRYIAFLDSDDLWYEKKLEKQLKLMKEKRVFFSYTAIEMIDEEGKILKEKREVKEEITYNFLLKNTMIATSSVIVDKLKYGEFQMPLRRSGQDYATWLQLLKKGKAYGINEVCVSYRVRKGSLSSNKIKSIKQVYDIQTQQEKINKIKSIYNCLFFLANALKKYLI